MITAVFSDVPKLLANAQPSSDVNVVSIRFSNIKDLHTTNRPEAKRPCQECCCIQLLDITSWLPRWNILIDNISFLIALSKWIKPPADLNTRNYLTASL